MKTFEDSHQASKKHELTSAELKAVDRIHFMRKHPELGDATGTLLGTVMCCDQFDQNMREATLEAAHAHIFGTKTTPGCKWCERNFNLAREERERLRG